MLRTDRGDTIIEVLLAITVFSLVSVGAMIIMNQGTNASQRALEITQVRQQIDAQAEALRAAQQAYLAKPDDPDSAWNQITEPIDSGGFTGTDACPAVADDIADSFVMDARTAQPATNTNWFKSINEITSVDAPPYAQVRYGNDGNGDPEAYGIWIERTYSASGDTTVPDSYEFTVKACWFAPGLPIPLNLETSVRLYDPTS